MIKKIITTIFIAFALCSPAIAQESAKPSLIDKIFNTDRNKFANDFGTAYDSIKNDPAKQEQAMKDATKVFETTQSQDGGRGQSKLGDTNLGKMFENGQASFQAITELVQYSAYIIGLFLFIKGVTGMMKEAGDSRQGVNTSKHLTTIGIGISIFALTSVVEIVSATLDLGSGPGDLLSPPSGLGLAGGYQNAMMAVMTFIRMIGYISFIRGWLFLVDYGNGKQDGTMSRGLVHICGGVAAINIPKTVEILANTFVPELSFHI